MAGAAARRPVDDLPLDEGLVARFGLAVHREDLPELGHAQPTVGRPGHNFGRRAARGFCTLFFNFIVVAVDDGRVSRTRAQIAFVWNEEMEAGAGKASFEMDQRRARPAELACAGSLSMPDASSAPLRRRVKQDCCL